jgi:hypothetical protein
MATQVQWRGGSTAEHATFTGAAREVTVDTQKQTLVLHDGSTAGGRPLLREDGSNAALSLGSAGTPSLKFTGDTNTGIYSPGADQVAVATNGTGRLFVDATGNIGVGAAATANGVLRLNVASGNNANLVFSENNTDRYILGQVTGDNALRVYDIVAASERLRITSAGLVGIGSSSPVSTLDAAGDISITGNENYLYLYSTALVGSNARARIRAVGSGGGSGYGGDFRVSTRKQDNNWNTDAFVVDSSGNVGIGTTSPGTALEVINTTGKISARATTGVSSLALQIYNNGTDSYIDSTAYGAGSGGGIAFRRNGTVEMGRFDTSGRLLVGTSSTFDQSARLQVIADTGTSVAANFYSYGADNSQFFIGAARGTVASPTTLNSSDTIGGVYFRGHDGTSFKTGAQIQAQIDGITPSSDLPSRLVFSTTADGASSPTERMRIDSSGTHQLYGINDTLFSRTNRGAGTSYVTFAGVHSSTGPGTGTPSCFIYSNGNIQNTNNSYGAISDLKLKENIVDASSQWDDLKALQVRNYNFKEGQTHTQIGLVAQEAELVSPGLVSESPDRDAEGNDLGTVTKSVNYSVLYMKAVKALQEAMERIETLEAKVAALESA